MMDLSLLPEGPGCYLLKDSRGQTIYIGKAKNIKKRASSYFNRKNPDPKTRALVSKIKDIDFIATDSEVEALILENTLIKRNQPRYNIDLKDSKQYAYIEVTKERFPRMIISRRRQGNGEYFGPFVSAQERDYIMTALVRSFGIRTCRRLPRRACLRRHIGICSAPCVDLIGEGEYNKNVRKALLILKGKTEALHEKLTWEMEGHSKNLRYEQAIRVRDQILAVKTLRERQKMKRVRKCDEDIISWKVMGGKAYLMLFHVYRGTLADKQEFVFRFHGDFPEEFIVQYYSENPVPREIILPEKIEDSLIEFLEKTRKGKVSASVPKKGEKKQLLELAQKNIELSFFGGMQKLKDLKSRLKLNETPEVIECFDISHISGTSTVGSMVQFRYGKPDKGNYRRFKIRTVDGIDDVKAISEVVFRRYRRLKEESAQLPSLIVIDGGAGQLNAAIRVLEKLEMRLPVVALAKRLEEIYVPGRERPLALGKKDGALKLLQEIRDEAHRFALSYSRLLRKKEMIG